MLNKSNVNIYLLIFGNNRILDKLKVSREIGLSLIKCKDIMRNKKIYWICQCVILGYENN